jgi:hypothetical protein
VQEQSSRRGSLRAAGAAGLLAAGISVACSSRKPPAGTHTNDQAGAIAFSSPLSYPLVADQLPPMIGNILH